MIWIDGEYFEPLFFGSLQEQQMILSNELEKFRAVFWAESGLTRLCSSLISLICEVIA